MNGFLPSLPRQALVAILHRALLSTTLVALTLPWQAYAQDQNPGEQSESGVSASIPGSGNVSSGNLSPGKNRIDGLLKEAAQLRGDKKLQAALELELQALTLASEAGIPAETSVRVYNRIGMSYDGLKQYSQAVEYFEKGLRLADQHLAKDHVLLGSLLFNYGLTLRANKQCGPAIPLIERSILIAMKSLSEDSSRPAQRLRFLANCQETLQHNASAESSLLLALQIGDKFTGKDNASTITSLRALIGLLERRKEFKKVLAYRQRLVDHAQRSAGSASAALRDELNRLANALVETGDFRQAAEVMSKALAISEQLGSAPSEATLEQVSNLALLYRLAGNIKASIAMHEKALALAKALNNKEEVETLQRALAKVLEIDKQWDKFIALQAQILDSMEAQHGAIHENTLLAVEDLAEAYEKSYRYPLALAQYKRGLAVAIKLYGPLHPETATRYNLLGHTLHQVNANQAALDAFQQALRIREASREPDIEVMVTAISNYATALRTMGEFDAALPEFQRALAIAQKGKASAPVVATQMRRLASLHTDRGEFDSASALLHQAEKICSPAQPQEKQRENQGDRQPERQPDKDCRQKVLDGMVILYGRMGDFKSALALQKQALALVDQTPASTALDRASAQKDYAVALADTGDYAQAKVYMSAVAKLEAEKLDPDDKRFLHTLHQFAMIHEGLGDYASAVIPLLTAYNASVKAFGALHPDTMSIGVDLGWFYTLADMPDKALTLLLGQYVKLGANNRSALALRVSRAIAVLYYRTGKPALAIYFGKEAVNTIQYLRSRSLSLDHGLQSKLLDNNRATYEALARWLIESGRLPEAQQVLTMLKEDELSGITVRAGTQAAPGTKVSFSGAELKWNQQLSEVQGNLGKLAQEVERLQAEQAHQSSPELKKRLEQALDHVSEVQKQFEDRLESIQKEVSASGDRLQAEAKTAATRAGSNLRELLDKLAEDSAVKPAVLQYLVTDKKLMILVTLPALQFAKEVNIEAKTLRAEIDLLRRSLRQPTQDPRPQAQKLYKLLLEPVIAELKQAGIEHLMVSFTDALRYIPFAALYDGKRYVTQDFQVSLITEAALGARMDKPKAQWNVSALGVSGKVSNEFEALPAVASELKGITKTTDTPDGAMPGQIYLNEQFTSDQYRTVISQRPAVIHLATHFKFSATSDTQSYVLLGDGKSLTLREMLSERYRFRGLDLLTLSACETGLSAGLDQNGREMEGLGAQAQRYGAASVIATLWQVSDDSTGQLMKRFYSIRSKNEKMSKSEALRQAQLELIEGKVKPSTEISAAERGARTKENAAGAVGNATPYANDPGKPYAHPFYWAPFVLMGNWL